MFDLTAFLADPAGIALKALLVAAFLDFVTGTFAAVRDGSFTFMAIAAWLRKHLAGRVGPLAVLLVVLYLSGDSVMLATTVAAAGAYAAETIRSIVDNFATIMRPEPVTPPVVAAGDTPTGVIAHGGELPAEGTATVILDTANPVPSD